MQSTGHTMTHTGQPEHSSGTMTTSRPRSKIAPNSGGQLRRHVSQVIHSDDSMRRGGFFQFSLRDRVAIRADRPVLAPGGASFFQSISLLLTLGVVAHAHDKQTAGPWKTAMSTTQMEQLLNVASVSPHSVQTEEASRPSVHPSRVSHFVRPTRKSKPSSRPLTNPSRQ